MCKGTGNLEPLNAGEGLVLVEVAWLLLLMYYNLLLHEDLSMTSPAVAAS